jgi:SAM-dependent methyltransferase
MANGFSLKEDWSRKYDTRQGQYLACCQERLIRLLAAPRSGERVLFVGFIPPELAVAFVGTGCLVTTFTPWETPDGKDSPKDVNPPGPRIESGAELPYSDNEFDLVLLVAALEFAARPERVIAEAARVAHRRVFIGVLNRLAPLVAFQGGETFFPRELTRRLRSYHLGKMRTMIRECMGPVEVFWGSQMFFPLSWGKRIVAWEERIPLLKNPLGAFLGLSFPATGRFQTLQQALVCPERVLSQKRNVPARGLTRQIK